MTCTKNLSRRKLFFSLEKGFLGNDQIVNVFSFTLYLYPQSIAGGDKAYESEQCAGRGQMKIGENTSTEQRYIQYRGIGSRDLLFVHEFQNAPPVQPLIHFWVLPTIVNIKEANR